MGSFGEEFGDKRLYEVLRRSRTMDADPLAASLIDAATRFTNGRFDDDLTVVAIAVD